MQQVQYQLPQNYSQQPVLEEEILPKIDIENLKRDPCYTFDRITQAYTTYNGLCYHFHIHKPYYLYFSGWYSCIYEWNDEKSDSWL